MIAATSVVGIDVSRDWLDGFGFPGLQRFRLANAAEGHEKLIAAIREMPGAVKVGFEGREDQKSIRGIDFPNCARTAAVRNGCSGPRASRRGSMQSSCPRRR